MKPPPGFQTNNKNTVCKLQRSLYGLKQARHQWYLKLSHFLKSNNYNTAADHSLFLKHDGKTTTALLVYVDYIVLTRKNLEKINNIIALLHRNLSIKNLGDLTYFLGLEITLNNIGIHLSQRKYTMDLLEEIGMPVCAPSLTPMTYIVQLTIDKGNKLNEEEASSYRRLKGCLIYLTNTRLDISYSTNHLSQFIFSPTSVHYQAIMHVIRYLKVIPGACICLHNNTTIQIKAYNNSNWASCPETRKYITRLCIYLGYIS